MPAKSRDLLLAVTTRSDSSTFRWKAYPGLVSEGIQSGCSGGRELSKAYQLLLVSAIRQLLPGRVRFAQGDGSTYFDRSWNVR